MVCKKCESERSITISGKVSDLCAVTINHLSFTTEGYPPLIPNVCGNEMIRFTFCVDCGTIQGYQPMSDNELLDTGLVQRDTWDNFDW